MAGAAIDTMAIHHDVKTAARANGITELFPTQRAIIETLFGRRSCPTIVRAAFPTGKTMALVLTVL